MKHYIVPTLATRPDEIILHIGTNDIEHSSSQQIVKGISEIGKIITEASSRIKVTISADQGTKWCLKKRHCIVANHVG